MPKQKGSTTKEIVGKKVISTKIGKAEAFSKLEKNLAREIYIATKAKFPYIRETILAKHAVKMTKEKSRPPLGTTQSHQRIQSYIQAMRKQSCYRFFRILKRSLEDSEDEMKNIARELEIYYNKDSVNYLISIFKT